MTDHARHRLPSRGEPAPESTRWDAYHRRVTFYCPVDLLAAIEAEMERSGRGKSRVIADVLWEGLSANARD